MITLGEQYGYKKPKLHSDDISIHLKKLENTNYFKFFKGRKENNLCYQILFDQDVSDYKFETSYYIGTDWIVENKLPINITPKLNDKDREINYLYMLSEALKHIQDTNHLQHLFEVDFNKALIDIEQSEDLLSPLLIIQFLHLLKKIVQKGLKKTYYKVEENLNSRIKGKLVISKTIKENHQRNKKQFTFCNYEMYGYDSIENRILKKALIFTRNILGNIRGIETKELYNLYNYIFPAFSQVSKDVCVKDLKQFKPNPLFKEYKEAILLAKLILKRYGYNISKVNSERIKTPPYWIDMSKLFELYVYGKLKEVFPLNGEIKYQEKVYYRELDFLLKSKDGRYKVVIDAKYKPRYAKEHINIDDLRQISGYSRMSKVYNKLEVDFNENIDCLIIHPDQLLCRDNFKEIDFKNDKYKVKGYINIFNIGISLPEI